MGRALSKSRIRILPFQVPSPLIVKIVQVVVF
jgi:hypothetical protein